MGFDLHTVAAPAGTNRGMSDRKVVGHLANVANAPGSGAGASVTTAVSGLRLPPVYVVQVAASQDAVAFVTGKTASGFSVTLSPRLAANTLAAGTFDVLIVG